MGNVQGIGTEVETSEDRTHFADNFTITDVTGGEGYSTTPPTSGRHWNGWAACGFYGPDQSLPDERIIHNMEHRQHRRELQLLGSRSDSRNWRTCLTPLAGPTSGGSRDSTTRYPRAPSL